jgi:hypothetical protein
MKSGFCVSVPFPAWCSCNVLVLNKCCQHKQITMSKRKSTSSDSVKEWFSFMTESNYMKDIVLCYRSKSVFSVSRGGRSDVIYHMCTKKYVTPISTLWRPHHMPLLRSNQPTNQPTSYIVTPLAATSSVRSPMAERPARSRQGIKGRKVGPPHA